MSIFSILKKKEVEYPVTDADFDKLFKIVLMPGYNDYVPEVYLNTDKHYESSSGFNKKTAIILPFSKGVETFCIKRMLPITVESDVDKRLLKYFVNYLRLKGCSDKVVDLFIECWSPTTNELPPYKKIYDKNGKLINIQKR